MRYLVGFVLALALVASPLSVSAESEGATPAPSAEESAPSPEHRPEEPTLQLELDEAGTAVVEMQRRVRNAKIGLGISILSVCVGAVLVPVALRYGIFPDDPYAYTARDDRIGIASLTLLVGGIVSSLATGILLRERKRTLRRDQRKLRELRRELPFGASGAHPASSYGRPRIGNALEVRSHAGRVQWDLARSRLVF